MKNKIVAFFICFFVMICAVYANGSTDITDGNDGNSTSCTSPYCYHVSVGIRLTAVKLDTGERCLYDPATKTLCGNTGTLTKSVDIWATTSDTANQYIKKDACRSYNKMHTKLEFLNAKAQNKLGAPVKCTSASDYQSQLLDLSDIGLSTFSNDKPSEFVDRVKSVVTDMNNMDYTKINKILRYIIGDNNIKFTDLTVEPIYKNGAIQVEQIIAYGGSSSGTLMYNYYGTVAEVTHLFATQNIQTWCVTNTNTATAGSIISCSDTMGSGGYITGFYGEGFKNSAGVVSSSVAGLTVIKKADMPAAVDRSSFEVFWKKNTVNVSHILLSEGLKCEKFAKDVYDSDFSKGKAAYENALLSNDAIKAVCGNTIDSLKNKCNNLLYENAQLYGKNSLVCSSSDCNTFVNKAYNKTSSSTTLYNYFKNFLSKLYGFRLLDPDVVEELGMTKVKCEGPPDCSYSANVNVGCGNSIEIKDGYYSQSAAEQAKCWKEGFAYSWASGGDYASSLDMRIPANLSEDPDKRIEACNVYCSQRVTLTMPPEPSTKAGTLLKWGLDRNRNELFGTMKVEKVCLVKAAEGGTCRGLKNFNYVSASKWVDNVFTLYKINYTEPTAPEYNLTNRELQLDPQKNSAGVNNTTLSNNSISCSNKTCSNVGLFTTSQVFDVVYKDRYKWYSDKETGKFVEKQNVETSREASYYEVGYGLPTAFTTPEGEYGESKGKGLLNATIEKLGYNITSGVDRFGKAIKAETGDTFITYSCNFKIKNELYQEECEFDEFGNPAPGSPEYCYDKEVKDIDVVFRTITLLNPNTADNKSKVETAFPGRAGTSRKIGRNWWHSLEDNDGNKLTTDDARYDRIVEILDNEVYQNNKPQYIIKLDSVSIKEIRKQNKAIKNDNYTKNNNPYTNFDIITNDNETVGYKGYYCYQEGDRKYCSSRFLTYLAEQNYLWGYCLSQSGGQGSYERTTTRAKNIAKGKYCLQS